VRSTAPETESAQTNPMEETAADMPLSMASDLTLNEPLFEAAKEPVPFDDSATIADNPMFSREALQEVIASDAMDVVNTKTTATETASDDSDETPSTSETNPFSQTLDARPSNVKPPSASPPIESEYDGPFEPFPPFSETAAGKAIDDTNVSMPVAEHRADSTEAMDVQDVAITKPDAIDSTETADTPEPAEVDPPTVADVKPTKPSPDTIEEASAPAQESTSEQNPILDIDDLLEAGPAVAPPSLPPTPTLPPTPPLPSPDASTQPIPDTNDELMVLEDDFFERADDHVEMEHALDKGMLDSRLGSQEKADRQQAAQTVLTDTEVQDLSRTLGAVFRQEKQKRRVSLVASIVILSIVIGVGVAGAMSAISENKAQKKRAAEAKEAPQTTPVPPPPQQPKKVVVQRSSKSNKPTTTRRSARITDLDLDDLENDKTITKKRTIRAKAGNEQAVGKVFSEFKKKRKSAPKESINSKELERMAAEDRNSKGLMVGLETKAANKKRAINNETISKLIGLRMRRFERCSRRNGPNMTVKLSFDVLAAGGVSNIRVRPSTGPDRVVENCIRGIIGKWSFPPGEKKQTFHRTLVLQ